MPFVDSEGVRIYYEVEGQGPPQLFMHGWGVNHSARTLRTLGYVKELKGGYRLILPDARGHGDSEKPHDIHA